VGAACPRLCDGVSAAGLRDSCARLAAAVGLGPLQRKNETVKFVMLFCIGFTPALWTARKDCSLSRTHQYSGSIQACIWEDS